MCGDCFMLLLMDDSCSLRRLIHYVCVLVLAVFLWRWWQNCDKNMSSVPKLRATQFSTSSTLQDDTKIIIGHGYFTGCWWHLWPDCVDYLLFWGSKKENKLGFTFVFNNILAYLSKPQTQTKTQTQMIDTLVFFNQPLHSHLQF